LQQSGNEKKRCAYFAKLLSFLIILSFVMAKNGFTQTQENPMPIPRNTNIEIHWIAPPDTDVTQYKIYFTNVDSVDTLLVEKWWAQDTTCMIPYQQSLPLGPGFVDMTAIDRAGNESEHSDKFYYEIYDARPGKPYIITIQIK